MKQSLKIALLLSPALTVILLFFVGGLALALMQSVGYMPIIGRTEVSLDAYRAVFSRKEFFLSLALTTWISIVSTAVSVGSTMRDTIVWYWRIAIAAMMTGSVA